MAPGTPDALSGVMQSIERATTDARSCRVERRTQDEIGSLCREHDNIARLLVVLESQLARLHADETCDLELLSRVVEYLGEYVDSYHRRREDRLVLALSSEPAASSIVGDLAAQHDAMRQTGAALREQCARASQPHPVARRAVVRSGFAYSAALRRNMAFEESALLSLATEQLTTVRWIVIDDAREREDDPLFGEVVEERYRRLYEELTRQVGCDCHYV